MFEYISTVFTRIEFRITPTLTLSSFYCYAPRLVGWLVSGLEGTEMMEVALMEELMNSAVITWAQSRLAGLWCFPISLIEVLT